MNQIAALLPPSNIVVDLDVGSKAAFFTAIGERFEQSAGLPHARVAASLAAREKLGSTGLGQGIAIPHGRMARLAEAVGAFARLRTPIAFDAPDGKPVDQIFVLLVPEQATDRHLQLLSELAQMFSQRAFRERLAGAQDAAAIAALFRDWQPES
ncbi:MAG TPA: PTS IIA-like nitrogen regulatory protein PtsN [Casimicrobiaceae bacterium]|nr:PTS IIA-like nitrogen regulatory protein PtsN [Casimicrobiaceae bacterium]